MSQIDNAIRRALSPEDLRALDELSGEEPIIVQAMQAFRNQQGWVRFVGWAGGFLLFGAGCYCVWRLLETPDLRSMILWTAAAGLAAAGLGMIKLWFFMEMQKNSIIREIKRLELQVASLRAS